MSVKKFEVKLIFPFESQKEFMIHIINGEWTQPSNKIEFKLKINNRSYEMDYIGFSNMNGDLVFKVKPKDEADFNEIASFIKEITNNYYVDKSYVEIA